MVAFTSLATASTSTSNTSSYAGTAGTPASGDLLICCAFISDTAIDGTMSGAWTWNHLVRVQNGIYAMNLFWARATAATSTTPTFSCTGDNGTGGSLHCWRITGTDGGPGPYIRQIKTATGTGANAAIAMDTAILTGNGCLSFVGRASNTAGQWTAPTSWATAIQNVWSTPSGSLGSSSRASGETGSTITWTNAQTAAWQGVVIELYNSGAGPVPADNLTGYYGGNSSIG